MKMILAAVLALTGPGTPAAAADPGVGSLAGASVTIDATDAAGGEPVTGFCATAKPSGAGACTEGSTLTLRDVPAGEATISVQPVRTSDYLPSAPVTLTLADGAAVAVTTPLTLGGRLSALVLDRATGAGVRLACLVLIEPASGGLPSEGRGEYGEYEECTNNNGKLTTYARPAGTYQLFVFGPERLFLPEDQYGHQWVGAEGGTGDQRRAVKLKIRPGRTTQAPTVLMDKPGTIVGQVTDASGEHAGSAITFNAWPIFSRSWNGAAYPGDGTYSFTHLGPYEWPIMARPTEGPDGAKFPRQWSGGTGNRYQAETVAVRSGETSRLDLTLQPFAAIAGTITAPEGGTLIAANASTGDELGYVRFTGSGPYRLPLVGGQRVTLRWVLNSGRGGVWADGEQVPVPKGGTRALDLTVG
ncbi:hypothetical protein [Actinoplanes sp. NBRC 103695]|uniref:hypothetical protein n=1 Tax=Actinoplanes sp. NBRC 103695 TaxID=3032202 RepID=UPI002553867C|nr:hypothetical protein [Actinoplanes sp. NBRC 103695]